MEVIFSQQGNPLGTIGKALIACETESDVANVLANILGGGNPPPVDPSEFHLRGLIGERPSADPSNEGYLFSEIDASGEVIDIWLSDGTQWLDYDSDPAQSGVSGHTSGTPIDVGLGTLANPALIFGDAQNGLYSTGANILVKINGAMRWSIGAGGILAQSNQDISGVRDFKNIAGEFTQTAAGGASLSRDRLQVAGLSINTSALTTETPTNLLPQGSLIVAVCGRITQTITGATQISVGTASDPARFGIVTDVQAGTPFVLLDHIPANKQAQTLPEKIVITADSQPSSGQVTLVSWFDKVTAPVS